MQLNKLQIPKAKCKNKRTLFAVLRDARFHFSHCRRLRSQPRAGQRYSLDAGETEAATERLS